MFVWQRNCVDEHIWPELIRPVNDNPGGLVIGNELLSLFRARIDPGVNIFSITNEDDYM